MGSGLAIPTVCHRWAVCDGKEKYSRISLEQYPEMAMTSERILDSGDGSLFDVQSKARGPQGSVPVTPEMLLHRPSGDLFGWTQNAGMGWDPGAAGRQGVSDSEHARRHSRGGWDAGRAGLSHGALGSRRC